MTRIKKTSIVLIMGVILALILRLFFIVNGLDVADVYLMKLSAEIFISGGNPYVEAGFYIYPPLALLVEGISLFAANTIGSQFHIILKIIISLFDFGIAYLIYKIITKNTKSKRQATFWSLFYLLNPLTIIITGAHGQIEPISSFFVLLAYYLLISFKDKKIVILSALMLGFSIMIKANPVILVPLFIISPYLKKSLRIKYFIAVFVPLFITMLPFITRAPQEVIQSFLGYSGVNDFGYAGILRAIYYQQNADIWLPLSQEITSVSKYALLGGSLVVYTLFWRSKALSKAIIAVYLVFIGIYFGVSAQHLLWILPFVIIERSKMAYLFTFVAIIAFFGFYTFFGPDILFGKLLHFRAHQSAYMSLYFLGNLLLWVTVIGWLLSICYERYLEVVSSKNKLHLKLVYLSLIVFALSMIPKIKYIWMLISNYIYV